MHHTYNIRDVIMKTMIRIKFVLSRKTKKIIIEYFLIETKCYCKMAIAKVQRCVHKNVSLQKIAWTLFGERSSIRQVMTRNSDIDNYKNPFSTDILQFNLSDLSFTNLLKIIFLLMIHIHKNEINMTNLK